MQTREAQRKVLTAPSRNHVSSLPERPPHDLAPSRAPLQWATRGRGQGGLPQAGEHGRQYRLQNNVLLNSPSRWSWSNPNA